MRQKIFILIFSMILLFVTTASAADVVDSKASILMEASTGQVVSSKNHDQTIQIGVLNKIMTVLLVAEAIDDGKISLDTMVTASARANSAQKAVIWLESGEKMSVRDLIKGTIIGNANDAAIALAESIGGSEKVFADMMNARAKGIGMMNTNFENCTGYDADGQYSTAYDVALMSRELVKHEWLYEYMTCWRDSLRGGKTELVNTNILVKNYKGIIGIKAGFSEAAGHCVAAAAKRDGVTYISVVIGHGDKDSLFKEARGLMNTGFSGYELVAPNLPKEIVSRIRVKGGISRDVGVRIDNLIEVVIPKGQFGKIKNQVTLPTVLEAPIKDGQVIGEIVFMIEDRELYRSDLLSNNEVRIMSFQESFGILVQKMLDV